MKQGRTRVLVAAVSAAMLTYAAAVLVPLDDEPAAAAPPGFVTAAGDALVLDGAPYRFTGMNVYNANNTGGCWNALSDTVLGQSLDAIGGERVVRAWFFQSLATSGGVRDWTSFDRTLAYAAARGMKVIPTLGNQWGACDGPSGGPGVDKNEAWYTSGYSATTSPGSLVSYRDWVAEIVARYANDPTILAWQLMNEAEVKPVVGDGLPCSAGAAVILREFADDVSTLVKSIDPDHLVSLGTIGGGQCGTSFEEYAFVHDLPTIDLCEYHDYGAPAAAFPGDEFNGLAKRVAQCDALDKPLIIGETGIRPTDVDGTLAGRASAFRAKLEAQLAAGIDGVALWAWNPAGSTLADYDIGPGDPALAVLSDVLAPACVSVDTTGIIGWWRGDGTLAAQVGPDASGTAVYGTGHAGQGFSITPNASLSATGVAQPSTALTLELWAQPQPSPGVAQTLISRWTGPGMTGADDVGHAYNLELHPNDELVFETDDLTTRVPEQLRVAAPQLVDGGFHHIAATWTPTTMTLYIDGVQVATKASQGGQLQTGAPTAVRIGGPFGYTGVIDEPTIWSRALTPAEVATIGTSPTAPKCA